MGISLSNHEDRIKALENISSSGIIIKKLNSATGTSLTLSENITNYQFVFVKNYNSNGNGFYSNNIWPVSILSLNHRYLGGMCSHGSENDWCSIVFTAWNKIQISQQSYYPRIEEVYGLKLYYNFSYNIYALVVSISKSFLKCLIKIRN